MLAGQAARMQCFDVASQGGLLPADLDGPTAPPAGTPDYLVNIGSNALNLWKFHVDWGNPASSSFTGPTSIKAAPFEIACRNAANPGQCVVQPKTQETLDTLSDRLMFRLAYRRFSDHEAMVVNHAVIAGPSSGVRWYELRDPGGTPTVFQQGTFAPDAAFRWMASIAMDKAGNMLMGYSVSSSKIRRPSVSPAVVRAIRAIRWGPTAGRRRQGFPDNAGALGRLREHEHRPNGRLHVLVLHPVRLHDRQVQLEYQDHPGEVHELPVDAASGSADPTVVGDCDLAELLGRHDDRLLAGTRIGTWRQRPEDVPVPGGNPTRN